MIQTHVSGTPRLRVWFFAKDGKPPAEQQAALLEHAAQWLRNRNTYSTSTIDDASFTWDESEGMSTLALTVLDG